MKKETHIKYWVVLICIFALSLFAFQPKSKTTIHKDSALKAFTYLNAIRQNPGMYSKELGVNLKNTDPSNVLIWDEILAKEAERKAMDLATNNYFAHVDKKGYGMNYYVNKSGFLLPSEWLDHKKNNQIDPWEQTPIAPMILLNS